MVSSSRPPTVSRTSSASSIDFTANAFNPTEARRTRKRISAVQLAHLEELYRQSSHPTRDQRDALAKRVQMETKSVTIWFQNKRQTDRKVALHNATNSRNVTFPRSFPPRTGPDITLTTPSSPTHPTPTQETEGVARRLSSDGIVRRQLLARPVPLKRTLSLTSSATSTTNTATSAKTRISLDRVASRSEIRFSNRHSLARRSSSTATLGSASNASSVACTSSHSAPLPSSRAPCSTSQPVPTSPSPNSSPPLWETMLSSPAAPSSPPPPEYATFTRARKARTLDWACAAARLPAPEPAPPSWPESAPESAFSAAKMDNSIACVREYDEASSMTEDEAELVTPHGSQDDSIKWAKLSDASFSSFSSEDVMEGIITANVKHVSSTKWEESEVHAALALCGLRG